MSEDEDEHRCALHMMHGARAYAGAVLQYLALQQISTACMGQPHLPIQVCSRIMTCCGRRVECTVHRTLLTKAPT